MTKEEKIKFIQEIERLGFNMTDDAKEYFEKFKAEVGYGMEEQLSEKAILIMVFMQNNYNEYNNLFSAKNIGEGITLSPKSVSGSMRKLVTNGYVDKTKSNVVMYSLTEKGKNFKVEE